MRYLCTVCYEQKTLDSLSKPEFDALVTEALAYDDELRNGGHYLYSGALQSVETATILNVWRATSDRYPNGPDAQRLKPQARRRTTFLLTSGERS